MSIATEIERLQNAKTSMKTAIENKGVEVGDGTIDTYASKIDEISVGSEENPLVKYVEGYYTQITPDLLDGATKLAHYIFYGRPFTRVELPSSITTIENYVFYACSSMRECILPNNLKSIGNASFQNCSVLSSIDIPSSVKTLGSQCFNGCFGLTAVTLNEGLQTINQSVFYNCQALKEINFPNTLTSIGGYAFVQCYALKSLEFPDSLTIVDQYTFDKCTGLKKVVFQSTLTAIKTNAFRGCSNVEVYDFRKCKQIVSLATEFSLAHATGCKIVVPDEFYDKWSTGTNWVAQDNVVWVKASEYVEE